MPPDKTTILENAQLYASRGQYDKAIAEWKKLAALAPADGTIHNTIGDLHLKRNALGEAVEAYLAAASAFQAAGAPLKAIAVYKKILKVDPGRYTIYKQLGDLNAERGLLSNAISDYLVLAKGYLKEGRTADAIEVYRMIVGLDPSQVEVRQKLASLCLQENRRAEAAEAFVALGCECLAQQRPAEAREACLSALRIEPEYREAQQLLRTLDGEPGEVEAPGAGPAPAALLRPSEPGEGGRQGSLNRALRLTGQGQYEAAETLLTELLSAEPGDPEICRLLATLHLRRGLVGIAQSEFKFLAESAMRAQDFSLAESMIREYLQADPGCVVFTELLGQLYEQTGEAAAAAAQYGKALEHLLAHPDPDYPTLPLELYAKIRLLDPASALVTRYAPLFETPPAAEPLPPPAAAPSGAARWLAEEAGAREDEEEVSAPFASAEAPAQDALEGVVEEVPAAGGFAQPQVQPVSAEAADAGEAPPDYEGHLELGAAYRRLGLLEEAVAELQIAVGGPTTFLEASLELACCWRERGEARTARAVLEDALGDPRSEGTAGDPLRYALAGLYETEGELDRAVQLYARIPMFKDAAVRVERLERMRGGARAPCGIPVRTEPGPALSRKGEPVAEAPAVAVSEPKKRRISYL
ncbi:tetratricopeptide repeat protein [Nitrospira sp. Kam-Ns4a]